MSIWRSVICETHGKSLWLEKYVPEYFPDSLTDYAFMAKTKCLVAFLEKHSGCKVHCLSDQDDRYFELLNKCDDREEKAAWAVASKEPMTYRDPSTGHWEP